MNISSRLIVIVLLIFILCTFSSVSATNLSRDENATPSLTVSPASIVIKVGDSTNVTITLTNSSSFGRVCFGVEGFPTSGFVTTIVPLCALLSPSPAVTILTVEATPAAAPQSFTASVVATTGNWTIRTPIDVTVVPAMSAWIPWSIVIGFVLILAIPLVVKWKPHRR